MKIKPLTINKNQKAEFESCDINDLSVLAGGYVITPLGEIIVVKDNDKHCDVFTKLINNYLENETATKYNTLTSTRMLCEMGCCVYAGVRLEYIKNRLESLSNCIASLTFPSQLSNLTSVQREICTKLLESNVSPVTKKPIIYIQFGSFPDNVFTEEVILEEIVTKTQKTKIKN